MKDMQLRILVGAVILCGTAACSDTVRERARVASPDGQVVAVYRQYLYGGAAGGIGHCINLEAPSKHDEKPQCQFLASKLENPQLRWSGRVLTIGYTYATITKFANSAYFPRRSGDLPVARYEIRLNAVDASSDSYSNAKR